jgi:hypothetical protein
LRCHRPSRGPAMATVSREPHSGRVAKVLPTEVGKDM